VLEAISAAAKDLANTPAICRKSYVHDTVVTAFEQGILQRFSRKLKNSPSPTRLAKVLAQIVADQSIERSWLRASRAERRQSTG